jgi:hypothetical protein
VLVDEAAERLRRGDPTIFRGPTAARRLGWLEHPATLAERAAGLYGGWTARCAPRYRRTLVVGMGGSSSTAGMLASAADVSRLGVLDTSNPDSIAAAPFGEVNVIASSKSGTTIETVASLAWALDNGLETRDLTVVTDPGTPLEELAGHLGAPCFHGDPATGGRFSALSAFALVPAFAAGWTPGALLETGLSRPPSATEFAEWFQAGVRLADEALDGVGFLELPSPPHTASASLWLEQLVAESTGKDGRGLIPVVGASPVALPDASSLVRDVHRWHVMTAAAAWRLDVDPFDQPDVDGAKRNVFVELARSVPWRAHAVVTPADLDRADRARYVTLQVFGPLELDAPLESLRRRLGARFGHVTAGLGPRFLHATGQLHKGGPPDVVAIQVQIRPRSEPRRIAGRHYSFHDLHAAQARGDARALREAGRHVIELRVETLEEVGVALGL